MAKNNVTKAEAEKVLQSIKDRWPESKGYSHMDGPDLYPAEHEGMEPGCWSIAWEGAPEGWAYEAVSPVPGVFVEAMYSWCLGVYPA